MISWFVQLNSCFYPTIWFVLKYTPNWCLICCSLTSTGPKNYQTIPNQLKIEIWTENINLNNFYPWKHHDFWPYFRVTKSDFRFLSFFNFLGPVWRKNFHGPKLWVTASLTPEVQVHNDTSASLRSHFCSNFNWTQYFFLGLSGPNFAWMWSVCTSAFQIGA